MTGQPYPAIDMLPNALNGLHSGVPNHVSVPARGAPIPPSPLLAPMPFRPPAPQISHLRTAEIYSDHSDACVGRDVADRVRHNSSGNHATASHATKNPMMSLQRTTTPVYETVGDVLATIRLSGRGDRAAGNLAPGPGDSRSVPATNPKGNSTYPTPKIHATSLPPVSGPADIGQGPNLSAQPWIDATQGPDLMAPMCDSSGSEEFNGFNNRALPPTPKSPVRTDSVSYGSGNFGEPVPLAQEEALDLAFYGAQTPSHGWHDTSSMGARTGLRGFPSWQQFAERQPIQSVSSIPIRSPQSQSGPATPVDPMVLLHPELLPDFAYVASRAVANEARAPDVVVVDDGSDDAGSGRPRRLGKSVSKAMASFVKSIRLNRIPPSCSPSAAQRTASS